MAIGLLRTRKLLASAATAPLSALVASLVLPPQDWSAISAKLPFRRSSFLVMERVGTIQSRRIHHLQRRDPQRESS